MLTKLSFEIKTEIRFIPNDAAKPPSGEDDEAPEAQGAGLPRPEVKAQVSVRDRAKEGRRHPRRREET